MASIYVESSVLDEAGLLNAEFRPNTLHRSVGLISRQPSEERRCTDSELLQYFIEMESSREHLQRTAGELNRQVNESEEAAREAKTAAQAKSDFLAMMSHEIRTPLNAIIGMTSILMDRQLDGPVQDYIETIRKSGEALLSVVDDILDFSKIEAGRLLLDCSEFEIATTLEEALRIVYPAAAKKSLRLVTLIDPALPTVVRGDAARLRQIFLNLLSNAIKFTPSGKVELKAELKSSTPDGYELKFSITDQGVGLTDDQKRRLFQAFTQAEASTSRQYGGTGLGLVICKKLAELMGGSIGVDSRYGHGSTFWFTAKMLASTKDTTEVRTVNSSAQQLGDKDCNLLLVEDNPINQKVALLMLKKLGYKAEIANNGVEALTAVSHKRYDLILMDCFMPELDGFETTRRIRSIGGRVAQIPIIAMTASAFVEDRNACLEAGMTDYLSKPVRESELHKKLAQWLP